MGNGENSELLDLKMKTSTESSYPYKSSLFISPSSHSGDDGGSGCGGPGDFVGSDIYDVVSSDAALSSRPLQQPFNYTASTVLQQLSLYSSVFLFGCRRCEVLG